MCSEVRIFDPVEPRVGTMAMIQQIAGGILQSLDFFRQSLNFFRHLFEFGRYSLISYIRFSTHRGDLRRGLFVLHGQFSDLPLDLFPTNLRAGLMLKDEVYGSIKFFWCHSQVPGFCTAKG